MSTLIKSVAAVAVTIIGFSVLAAWAVEYLWLDTLGYDRVFWTIRTIKIGFFCAAFVPIFLYFWINLRLLNRHLNFDGFVDFLRNQATIGGGPVDTFMRDDDEQPASMPMALTALAALIAFAFASFLYGRWDVLLRFHWAQEFGQVDPLFGQDIGFYLFVLPFLELQQNGAAAATMIGSVLVVVAYAYGGGLTIGWRSGFHASRPVYWHVAINLALFLFVRAWGYFLDRYALLQAADGVVYGAGFTDDVVTRPALWIVLGATIALSIAVLVPRLVERGGMVLTAIGGYVAILFFALMLIPWGVQRFVVEPNELLRETPYLRHNIALTRQAFGLDKVEERPYDATERVSLEVLERNRETVENIRLWDWRPLSQAFRQLQQIRTYYQFNEVDTDRYMIDGRVRQVMLSPRELSDRLPGKSETWLNRRLQYTHGYGLAMSLTAEVGPQGDPVLLVKDLPPTAVGGLSIEQPAIYYGTDKSGYRIVRTGVDELDYPKGDENVYSRYQGKGGIRLDSLWKKVLLAWHRLDVSILFTGYITDDSRLQLWRTIQERVSRIAPFLRLDDDPYLVLAEDGRLYWIQDAYTTSNGFPYAEPYREWFNYIRNSLKIVVDAYSGDVTFYVMDAEDPVLDVYREALPVLFKPLSDLPDTLLKHLRYPRDLFDAQVGMYRTYHVTVPQVFYNGEDVWAQPREKYGGEQIVMQPYFILSRLPGEDDLQFLLMTPLTPDSRDNMIAWMAARSDFPDYGRLVVYKLPKERLFIGPVQMEAKIDQDTLISQQLSLWDQRGSRVIRGNLLVVPIEDSFFYVEPVYLISEGTNIPEIKRVIVSDGERLAMEQNREAAIDSVFGRARADQPAAAVTAAPSESASADRTAARDALAEAEAALVRGDWDAFGTAMQRLKGLLGE
jgi:uncharacterized membrane protein (UPF0182 family)